MLLKKYIELLTMPTLFFRKVKHEAPYRNAWLTYAAVTALSLIPLITSLLATGEFRAEGDTLGIIFIGLFFLPVIIAFAAASPFFYTLLPHLGLMLLGERGFEKTFKPITYGLAVSAPYSFALLTIHTLAGLAGSWNFWTENTTEFGAGSLITLLLTVVLVIGNIIHRIIVTCIGVAAEHRISAGRAFVGAFAIPWAIGILLYFVFFMAFLFAIIGATFG